MARFLRVSTSPVWMFMALIFLSVIPSSICRILNENDLKHICLKTSNPFACLDQFKSDNRSRNTDEKGLAEIAVDLAMKNANETHAVYNELYSRTNDYRLQEKYMSCSKNYNDAIRDLEEMKYELNNNRTKLIHVEINDALQEVNTCIRAFERDQIDPVKMDFANERFKLLCDMVKIAAESLVQK
ncbi:pectinesterase inhibitor-like [Olea europaea subsp. europaea]|uniref:Pectinesterase inhibitor-like n=1 Tax=Olea europaea subsp. europaea TaxID=158383 RepID=A0A8S0TWK1_OLEEU|nr:pectinesterase inhibitor-like [Olea europaea subsp. europaea]